MFPTFKRLHVIDFLCLFVCGVFLAIICGGVLNVINGVVSAPYFREFFHYPGGSPNWSSKELYWHTIVQGLREGMWFGIAMSAFFMFFAACTSKGYSELSFSIRYLPKIAFVAVLCWAVGGIVGIVIGPLLPNCWSYAIALGGSKIGGYRALWVMFSILGVYLGNIVALIFGCVWFFRGWRANDHSIS